MAGSNRLNSPEHFSAVLFEIMKRINPGVEDLALLEFRYALESLLPEGGWDNVEMDSCETVEKLIGSRDIYESIQLRPREGDRIVLDERIAGLTRMLFAGLVSGKYSESWAKAKFYFDVRGFFFLPRTLYFTDEVITHFGGKPYRSFEQGQKRLERFQGVGYCDFQEANLEIDRAFIEIIEKIVAVRGTPILITLAGPTAAGKTEITERLCNELKSMGKSITSIEVDNFLLDRDFRDNKPMGKESTHFELFISSLQQILQGKSITIPRYDFVGATSSHDLNGNLKPGSTPLLIDPADVIFMEGNFPFQMDEITSLIGIKVVYLTNDPIRLKRKWKRDIDYRKKYDPAYFRNRFFRTQFLRAEDIYRPLMKVCEVVVDTTGAALWVTPEITRQLEAQAGDRNINSK
jgi:uridine kinase